MVLKNVQYALLCLTCNIFVSYENILHAGNEGKIFLAKKFIAKLCRKNLIRRESQQKYLHHVWVIVYINFFFFLTNKIGI